MTGLDTLFEPGRKVPVMVVADSNGNVATREDVVSLTGENSEHAEAALVETAGEGVGPLDGEPENYDPDATYDPGEVVGKATVILRMAVDWFRARDGWDQTATDPATTSASVGDRVVYAPGGGVQLYGDEGGDAVVGVVYRTHAEADGTAGKVAVARFR